eukprot:TRINITY_DN3053_c0_g2_i1.p1 TRINITY_DN3053_c0_g2~~TRINITY_DN3053_c0_g2_i1.p1  ORF type:complete len:980 (+),score=197.67 TRINITY_DN3053_c0_g2_i1:74-2941(+)
MRAAAALAAAAGAAAAVELPPGLYDPSGEVPKAQAGADARDLASLRWLLYDGHAAPHADSLGFVRGALGGAPGKISSVCFYLYCHIARSQLREYYNESSSQAWTDFLGHEDAAGNLEATAARSWLTEAGMRASAAALAGPAGKQLADSLDIAVCSFPGHNCLRLASTGKTLLIRFAHRFDHWTRPSDLATMQTHNAEFFQVQAGWPVLQVSQYIQQLKELAASPKHIITVTNAFDWMYLYHYTGIRALPFPTTGAVEPPEWHPSSSVHDIPVIPGHGPQNRAIAWFVTRMADYERKRQQSLRVRHVQQYAAGGLSKYRCAVVLPYSLHAGMVVEAHAAGVPLFAPSLDFAATLQVSCGLVSHWTAQNLPRLSVDYLARDQACAESIAQSGLPSPIDAREVAHVREWLALADVYRLPYVTYFDSIEDLYRKLNHMFFEAAEDFEDRRAQSRAQRRYMRDLRLYTAATVGDAVARAVRTSGAPLKGAPEALALCNTTEAEGVHRGCLSATESYPGPNPTSCPSGCSLCGPLTGKRLNPLRRGHALAGGYAGYAGYGGYGGYGGYAGYGGYSATESPSMGPTTAPTTSPTTSPPTASPTTSPTAPPTAPTTAPTTPPTTAPTAAPSTPAPSGSPTAAPATSPPSTPPSGSPTLPPSSSPSTTPSTSVPSGAPTAAPTAGPAPPTASPTPLPSGAPTTSPTFSPSLSTRSPTATTPNPTLAQTPPPTAGATSSPTTAAPTTASPTVAVSAGTVIAPKTLGAAAIQADPVLSAIANKAVVPAAQINVATAVPVGPQTWPSRAGLPAVTLAVTAPPTAVTQSNSLDAKVPCTINRNEVLADPGGYKTALTFMFANLLGINYAQIYKVAVTFAGDGLAIGRRGQALTEAATVDISVCGTTVCGVVIEDDTFPGWAVALAIVLPVVGVMTLLGVFFWVVRKPEKEEETWDVHEPCDEDQDDVK